jgi:hypothetical protein
LDVGDYALPANPWRGLSVTVVSDGLYQISVCFAWLPVRLRDGRWVWLRKVRRFEMKRGPGIVVGDIVYYE